MGYVIKLMFSSIEGLLV